MAIPLPNRFQFISTEDGSPSLHFLSPDGVESESMHNRRGAFSETLYIYGDALQYIVSHGWQARVFSLGTGLAYNEILSATKLVATPFARTARVDSFEIDSDLQTYFASWINGNLENVPEEFTNCYNTILALCCKACAKSETDVRDLLKFWLRERQLRLLPALTGETQFDQRYTCFLFDAFSSKTSPDLWNEQFLQNFFEKTSEPTSVFSTYACTGNLKRALRATGFELKIREGFSSKRDCTFASKGN